MSELWEGDNQRKQTYMGMVKRKEGYKVDERDENQSYAFPDDTWVHDSTFSMGVRFTSDY